MSPVTARTGRMTVPVVSGLAANCSTLWLQQPRRSCLRNCCIRSVDSEHPRVVCGGVYILLSFCLAAVVLLDVYTPTQTTVGNRLVCRIAEKAQPQWPCLRCTLHKLTYSLPIIVETTAPIYPAMLGADLLSIRLSDARYNVSCPLV